MYIIYTHVFIFFVLGEQIMTDYQKMYQEKLTTPDKIAQQVQSGWLLGMDTATSQTPAIMTAIAERIRNSDITGVKVQALLDAYPFEFYTLSPKWGSKQP
ncbi:hypothetical protein OBE_02255 [human gut metagenome]|uniref:Uncharacterized protein n=1 Tax=human gut metagenome TaxID=408170 RepID=K1UQE7_9ZZZZ